MSSRKNAPSLPVLDEDERLCREEIVAGVIEAYEDADWKTDTATYAFWLSLLERFRKGEINEHQVCKEAMRPYLH